MSQYIKATNFATKDSLASGNPLKIVKGTEIDTEFNNIAIAVNSKADADNATINNATINNQASFADGSAAAPSITNIGDTNTGIFFPAADTIAFSEGGTEAMRIDSSSNVGIGTSSPGEKLSVAGNINLTGNGFLYSYNGGSPGQVRAGFQCDGTNQQIIFFTAANESARIETSGNLLVGTTSNTDGSRFKSYGNGTTTFCSERESTSAVTHVLFRNPNGIVGTISTNGSSTGYATSSDYRLKENIAPMTGALVKVAALKPCTYKWKSDGSDGEGFIAHELAEVVPQCVVGEKDAVDAEGNPQYQSIDTSFLVATLTAALQEAHGLIKALEQRVAALEGA